MCLVFGPNNGRNATTGAESFNFFNAATVVHTWDPSKWTAGVVKQVKGKPQPFPVKRSTDKKKASKY